MIFDVDWFDISQVINLYIQPIYQEDCEVHCDPIFLVNIIVTTHWKLTIL